MVDKLLHVWNDVEFVLGVISYLKNDDERQAIIDYINTGEDVTAENITLLSLHVANERKN
ncbi:MAG: hypothetical protein ACI39R_04220 [Lachnospiraceae bacterium]